MSLIVFLYLSHVSNVHSKATENYKNRSSSRSYIKSDIEVDADDETEKKYDPGKFYGSDSRV